ncbi:hypothetical protein GN956_G17841 [Arapaima gigas]
MAPPPDCHPIPANRPDSHNPAFTKVLFVWSAVCRDGPALTNSSRFLRLRTSSPRSSEAPPFGRVVAGTRLLAPNADAARLSPPCARSAATEEPRVRWCEQRLSKTDTRDLAVGSHQTLCTQGSGLLVA